MGVGVLIGRSGSPKPSAGAGAGDQRRLRRRPAARRRGADAKRRSPATGRRARRGYTVQLQTLPQSGTTVSAVEAAKSAASGKGAKGVGALKSEEFSSLTAGSYVIYSGDYHKQAEAEKALAGLKKSFPGREGDQGLQRRLRLGSSARLQRLVLLGRRRLEREPPGAAVGAEKPQRQPRARATRKSPRTSPTWSKRAERWASCATRSETTAARCRCRRLRRRRPPRRRLHRRARARGSAPAPTPAAPPRSRRPERDGSSELRRRRDALAEQVTELHWDLGGLAYEMAIRDHFRLDVLVRRAARAAGARRRAGGGRAPAAHGGGRRRRQLPELLGAAQPRGALLLAVRHDADGAPAEQRRRVWRELGTGQAASAISRRSVAERVRASCGSPLAADQRYCLRLRRARRARAARSWSSCCATRCTLPSRRRGGGAGHGRERRARGRAPRARGCGGATAGWRPAPAPAARLGAAGAGVPGLRRAAGQRRRLGRRRHAARRRARR